MPKARMKVDLEVERVPLPSEMYASLYVAECTRIAIWCGGETKYGAEKNEVGILVVGEDENTFGHPGDWIVKGVRGDFAAIPREEFEEYFELIKED